MAKRKTKPNQNDLSSIAPLDEIRQAEARMAYQVLMARQEAEAFLQSAREQAREAIGQKQLDGERDGRDRYDRLVQEVVHEAEQLAASARAREEDLQKESSRRIEQAAHLALMMVLGMEYKERVP